MNKKYIPERGELIRVSNTNKQLNINDNFYLRIFIRFDEYGRTICHNGTDTLNFELGELKISWKYYSKHEGKIHKNFQSQSETNQNKVLKLYL